MEMQGYLLHIGVDIREQLAERVKELVKVATDIRSGGFCDVIQRLARVVADLAVRILQALQNRVEEQGEILDDRRIQRHGNRSNGNKCSVAVVRNGRFQIIRLQFDNHLLHFVHMTVVLQMREIPCTLRKAW